MAVQTPTEQLDELRVSGAPIRGGVLIAGSATTAWPAALQERLPTAAETLSRIRREEREAARSEVLSSGMLPLLRGAAARVQTAAEESAAREAQIRADDSMSETGKFRERQKNAERLTQALLAIAASWNRNVKAFHEEFPDEKPAVTYRALASAQSAARVQAWLDALAAWTPAAVLAHVRRLAEVREDALVFLIPAVEQMERDGRFAAGEIQFTGEPRPDSVSEVLSLAREAIQTQAADAGRMARDLTAAMQRELYWLGQQVAMTGKWEAAYLVGVPSFQAPVESLLADEAE